MFAAPIDSSVISAPQSFTAGDGTTITIFDGGFLPSDGYTAKLILSMNGKVKLSVDGSDGADNKFTFTLTSEATADLEPGEYTYTFTFLKNSVRTSLEPLILYVNPNPETSLSDTVHQQQLAAVEQAILKVSAGDNVSVTFNGQSYTKRNLKDLMDFRDRLQVLVNADLRRLGLSRRGGAKTIATRFSR